MDTLPPGADAATVVGTPHQTLDLDRATERMLAAITQGADEGETIVESIALDLRREVPDLDDIEAVKSCIRQTTSEIEARVCRAYMIAWQESQRADVAERACDDIHRRNQELRRERDDLRDEVAAVHAEVRRLTSPLGQRAEVVELQARLAASERLSQRRLDLAERAVAENNGLIAEKKKVQP